jgi:hypothetical protein
LLQQNLRAHFVPLTACHGAGHLTSDGTTMTIELKLVALSIVLGLTQIVLALACRKSATRICLDLESTGQGCSDVDRSGGPIGRTLHNFVETFPLFAARRWSLPGTFSCMEERSDAGDRLDPPVGDLSHG